jgi:hypothetical protein
MRLLKNLSAMLCGLLVGAGLFLWYLAQISAEKSSMKMFLFIPMFEFHQFTMTDYIIAALIGVIGAVVAYGIVVFIFRLIGSYVPHADSGNAPVE